MADYSILPPGLAGYVMGQEHDQATQANALAQALQGVQIKSALMKQQQDQLNLDRQNRIRNRLTALATGDTGAATAASQEPYGGGYSPDVAKSFGVPAGAPAGASRPQAAPGLGQSLTQNFLRQAQILSEEGDFDNANKLYEHAAKFMPEVKEIRVEMQNGTPVNVITMKDGTQRVSGFSPTPKIHFADDGQRTAIPVDEYTGKPMGQGMQRFQDPNSKASNALGWSRLAQDERHFQNPNLQHIETDQGIFSFNPKSAATAPVNGPDGKPLEGAKGLTEVQAKGVGFATRARESSDIIANVGNGGKVQPGTIKRSLEAVPFAGEGLGTMANWTQSSEQQQVEQAQRNFVNAILRQESGAAISEGEFQNAKKQYFPQPGDSAEVIKQKAQNRETSIRALETQAGPGMKKVRQLGGAKPAQGGNFDNRKITVDW